MKEKLENIVKSINDIKYGYVDKDNNIHTNIKLSFFKDNYKFISIDDIKDKKIGTCYEQTKYINYLLDLENIDYRTFFIEIKNEKVDNHTFTVVEDNNKYYLLDATWLLQEYVYECDSLDEAIIKELKQFPKMFHLTGFDIKDVDIYEIDMIEKSLGYQELIEYFRSFDKYELND